MRTRHRAGTRDAVVGRVGHAPLGWLPRAELSPSPSCPLSLRPQHLTVASSCGKERVGITAK